MRRLSLACLLLVLPVALPAAAQKVSIRAYINVSSGCQAPTVDFLRQLKAKYAPAVSLELVDFGDGGEGAKRWQRSGHRCLAIEVNGSPLVKFPYQGKMRAVAFRMPVGFMWTHADLEHAVQAGLKGELQRATEAEVSAGQQATRLNAQVSTGQARLHGKRFAAVLINGHQAALIPVGKSTTAADKRASSAAKALRGWLAQPVKITDLTVKHTPSGWRVLAAGNTVITATAADGKALGKQPQAVVGAWLSGIKHALAARAAR